MNEELSPVDKFYEWHTAEMKDIEENGPKKRRGRKPTKKQYFKVQVSINKVSSILFFAKMGIFYQMLLF